MKTLTPEDRAARDWKIAKGEAKMRKAVAKALDSVSGGVFTLDMVARRAAMLTSGDEDVAYAAQIAYLEPLVEQFRAKYPDLDADAISAKVSAHMRDTRSNPK